MDVVYIPEVYFYSSLVVGIFSSLFIIVDLFFKKNALAKHLKWTWALFALLLFWGPSFLLWIIYEIKYRRKD
jgi:predicted permease